MDLKRLTVPQRLSAGSALVTILAAFLPWVSIFGISAIGVEGDGVITLILGIAGLGGLVLTAGVLGVNLKVPARVADIGLLVVASLVLLIALVDMNGAAAIGLYLTLFAGMAWVAGAVWQLIVAAQGKAGPESV